MEFFYGVEVLPGATINGGDVRVVFAGEADEAGLPGALEVLGDGELVRLVPLAERRNMTAPFALLHTHTHIYTA